jgi:hypothetical protein
MKRGVAPYLMAVPKELPSNRIFVALEDLVVVIRLGTTSVELRGREQAIVKLKAPDLRACPPFRGEYAQ